MLFMKEASLWGTLFTVSIGINAVYAQGHYPITGVTTGINKWSGARPARRSILELQKDLPSYSLFVLALNKLMQAPENQLDSYFQIGGIHGRPYISWDNVNGERGIPIGYCTHGNTLFPTWHRPYLALIEQSIADHAQDIAKTYNSRVYQKAADMLRLPYWDWADGSYAFPSVLSATTVQINTPLGLQNVSNPLFQYTFLNHPEPQAWFPTGDGGSDSWSGEQPTTIRWPDSNNQSRNSIIPGILSDYSGYFANQVWAVFAKSTNYNYMSTVSLGTGNSFEGPHGSLHVLVGGSGNGGSGHMTPVSFSGFDPVFWLHHCNVDRYFAMWQAIYPNSWMTPTMSGSGTWTIYPNTEVNSETPLTPFTTADGKTPWTSTSARYTKAFGYSYPDVQDWIGTPAELAANVSATVNRLYNPDGALGSWPVRAKQVRSSSLARRGTVRDWTVTLEVPNDAVGEGFSVGVTVGDVKVGKMFVISAPTQIEIDAGVNKVTKAEFALAAALGDVDTENVEAVVSMLKGDLKSTVMTMANGDNIPLQELNGLKIIVQDTIVTPATDITEFPTYGERTSHPEISAETT